MKVICPHCGEEIEVATGVKNTPVDVNFTTHQPVFDGEGLSCLQSRHNGSVNKVYESYLENNQRPLKLPYKSNINVCCMVNKM
jgi:hypothetical protein